MSKCTRAELQGGQLTLTKRLQIPETMMTEACPVAGCLAHAQYAPICTNEINSSPMPQLMYLNKARVVSDFEVETLRRRTR